jgi:hypothetical protein
VQHDSGKRSQQYLKNAQQLNPIFRSGMAASELIANVERAQQSQT